MFGIVAFEDVDVFHGAAHFAKEATTWGLRYERACSLRYERACRGPSSPFGLRRGSLRYERACRAEAGVACEGWWSQAGSNRRPLACHASALPAELWPLGLARAPSA